MDNIDNDIAVHLDLAKLSKLIKRVERGGENIVHGWDDKRNVAWWKDAFKVLKPPPRDDSVD